jgi:hypothetical protein
MHTKLFITLEDSLPVAFSKYHCDTQTADVTGYVLASCVPWYSNDKYVMFGLGLGYILELESVFSVQIPNEFN